ncbi:MAG: T9SS type A sorting domain-containing protein [Bacteroidota bacterium]
MKKKKPMIRLLVLILPVFIQFSALAQGVIKVVSGARIVSETSSYWVVENGSVTLTSQNAAHPATMANLTISNNASIQIPSLNYLSVTGTLTNLAGNAGLIVLSDATGSGSLIHGTTGVNGTVQRYIAKHTDNLDGWHFLSSPVESQAIQPDFVPRPPGSGAQDFFSWDEPSTLWINTKEAAGNWPNNFEPSFIVGKGYLVSYPDDATRNFTGVLNVSEVIKSELTKSAAAYSGWNLIGNPFSSAITWYTGWSLTNIGAVAKIWNGNGASYTDINPGEIIPSTQGFMVQVTTDPGTVTIPASARTHNSQAWYKSSGDPQIKLQANDISGQTFQETAIRFNPEATIGYDADFDAYFFAGYAPQFYSIEGGENLSTNVLPNIDSQSAIPLDFIKTEGSDYTIEAVKIEIASAQVYLTDLKINKTQNMSENPVYSFTSVNGDDPARFLLTFKPLGIENQSGKSRGIYSYDHLLFICDPGESTLEVFNMIGQKMADGKTHNEPLYKLTLDAPAGYYLVRLTTGQKVITEKIFIK